jgi:tRNA G18 (ribose-2'-O)-methylase SpoU
MKKLSLSDLNRVDVEGFKKQSKTPLVLVLDNIRSGLNVGSAFRTADAFALQHIYLCGITAQPPHREILKTAIGATEAVDWTYEENTVLIVEQLQAQGFQVFAVEQAVEKTFLQDFHWPESGQVALVFGNEVKGVAEAVMDQVDGVIEVPQFGTKHSLNISVCLGIVVWDLFKKISY